MSRNRTGPLSGIKIVEFAGVGPRPVANRPGGIAKEHRRGSRSRHRVEAFDLRKGSGITDRYRYLGCLDIGEVIANGTMVEK